MKHAILFLCFYLSLSAQYINNSENYKLIDNSTNKYMELVKQSFKKKNISKKELQDALSSEDQHPLSDILRVLAFDEVSDSEAISKHIRYLKNDSSLLSLDVEICLSVCDVLLRQGQYDLINIMLPLNKIVVLPKEQKNRAYYYLSVSKYLKEKVMTNEFLVIKYKFPASRTIYAAEKDKKEEAK